MTPDQPDWTCTLQTGSGNKIRTSDSNGFSAGDTGIGRPGSNGNGNNGIFNARPQGGNKGQGKDQLGKGKEDISDTHQNSINETTGKTGHRAHQQTNRSSNDGNKQDHVQGQAGTVQNTGIHIPSQLVGAEPVGTAHGFQPMSQIGNVGTIRGKNRCKNCDEQQSKNNDKSCYGKFIFRKGQPTRIGPAKSCLAAGTGCR